MEERKITNRLKRIEGQVRGVASMVDRGEKYDHVLNQVAAIRSALASLEVHILKKELDHIFNSGNTREMKKQLLKIIEKRK